MGSANGNLDGPLPEHYRTAGNTSEPAVVLLFLPCASLFLQLYLGRTIHSVRCTPPGTVQRPDNTRGVSSHSKVAQRPYRTRVMVSLHRPLFFKFSGNPGCPVSSIDTSSLK